MRRLFLGSALFVAATICMGAEGLEDKRWTLRKLGEDSITVENEQQRPYIMLRAVNQQVSGFGGCNSLQGSYKLQADTVRFRNMISTLRACADQAMNDLERDFLATLNGTRSYKLTDGELELSDGNKVLARFSAKE